jgi:hypothetical protein
MLNDYPLKALLCCCNRHTITFVTNTVACICLQITLHVRRVKNCNKYIQKIKRHFSHSTMTTDIENQFPQGECRSHHNLSLVGKCFPCSLCSGLSCSFVAVLPARDGSIRSMCAVPRLPKIKTVNHLADNVQPHLPTLPKFFQ